MAKKNKLNKSDLCIIFEYIRESSALGDRKSVILERLDISDEAWQEVLAKLDEATN